MALPVVGSIFVDNPRYTNLYNLSACKYIYTRVSTYVLIIDILYTYIYLSSISINLSIYLS